MGACLSRATGNGLAVVLALIVLATPLDARQVPPTQGPSVHVMGFGDVSYLLTERDTPDGFLLGQAVGHMSAHLAERVAVFGEMSATARPTGFTVELERLILRYDFSDAFKLSLGRYHTPVSYWNDAFHHGLWLQTSVARPQMIRFGGLLIPVHFVGALAEGSFPASGLGFGYSLGIGNGRGENLARAGDAGDVNGNTAVLAGIRTRPAALLGLEVGGGLYLDRPSPAVGSDVDERILTGYVALERETPEVMAEYARLRHRPSDGSGPAVSSDAFYVQVGYRLPGAGGSVKPYGRVERIEVPGTNPLLGTLGLDYSGQILGVRYDVSSLVALKLEARSERFGGGDRVNSLVVQGSFAIPGTGMGTAPIRVGGGPPGIGPFARGMP